MEQALRWVNNPGVDDRGIGEWGWMMPLGRDDVGDWFKNKCSDLPWSACVDDGEGLEMTVSRPVDSLELARSHSFVKDVRCF